MFIDSDWKDIIETPSIHLTIIVKETTYEETKLTLNSLFSSSENIEEIDYDIPFLPYTDNPKDFPIYVLTDNKNKWKGFNTLNSLDELSKIKYDVLLFMTGGYYSISYKFLQEFVIKNNIIKPTIFNTIPFGLNFHTENSFMIPSIEYHEKLIEMSLNNQIEINEKIIGIDKTKYMKFFESPLLSPIRTALALNTKIQYCYRSFDKLRQLSRAKYSINMKFNDLQKALTSRKTNDKIIKNYIKLLDSFSNGCTKEDYVFFIMMNKPELYKKAINMEIFMESLMEIDPNKNKERTIYSLLVEYTLGKF